MGTKMLRKLLPQREKCGVRAAFLYFSVGTNGYKCGRIVSSSTEHTEPV
jgi:hypothetical protein